MLHKCGTLTDVVDSRITKDGKKRRRRQCSACRVRFTTYEVSEEEMARYQDMEDVITGIKKLVKGAMG